MTFESTRSISMVPTTTAIVQARFVEVTTGGSIKQVVTASIDSVGIALEASDAGSLVAIPVAILDGAKMEVEAGAAITAGAAIGTDSAGRAVAVAAAVTVKHLGYALTAAGAAGEIVTIVGSKLSGFSAQV